MNVIAVSLGHNSSAVLIRDGTILSGFEEERFTGKKSDSSFPLNSILELKNRYSLGPDTKFAVGHWFLDGKLPDENKYWSKSAVVDLFPQTEILSLRNEFTHHDSHLESAMVFAGDNFADEYTAYVVDGFGTYGEHMSIYKCTKGKYELLDRYYGFNESLGLFYQYATAYLGLRMNCDEFKLLAYEVKVTELSQLVDLISLIDDYSEILSVKMIVHNSDKEFDLNALKSVQEKFNKMMDTVLSPFSFNEDEKKVAVAYISQRHIENVMLSVNQRYEPKNLLVVGGLFYNVKLNHVLANEVPGKFCVMPLAGDQGAGLGVYQHYFKNLCWPDHLFWGDRDFDYEKLSMVPGIEVVDQKDMFTKVSAELCWPGWVNVVRGKMEYGPRALCNTSTLALPDYEVSKMINEVNGRLDLMPFGLVVTEEQAKHLFVDINKVHKSLEYMIMVREMCQPCAKQFDAGYQYYPEINTYTCRPQITNDPLMVELLNNFGPLINTSFNVHGKPIVRGTEEVIYSHLKQREIDIGFKTLVEKEI